jgi:hypothetical protein
MASHTKIIALLLLFGLASAFDLPDLLYPGEQNVTVAYANFSLSGTNYSIVSLNGQETFLLQSGEPMTDAANTTDVLRSYYSSIYYPSQSDLNDLRSLIKQFNDSRNNGYDFKAKEEYVCRDDILLSTGKISINNQPVRCVDNTTCTRLALLLFSAYGEGLGINSASQLVGPLMNFTPPSLAIDSYLANYTSKLDSMDENTMLDTITYIKTTAPIVKNLSYKIENTSFRTPRLNDTADRTACKGVCFALCPSMELDQGALDQLAAKSDALLIKLGPLLNYKDVSAQIHNNTMTRLERDRSDDLATQYGIAFAPLNASGKQAIAAAEEVLTHVNNETLTTKLEKLKELDTSIAEDLASKSFNTTESDIAQYKILTLETANLTASVGGAYDGARNAKNSVNSLVLILQTKDSDPVAMKSLGLLINQTEDINARFRDGLTTYELNALASNYTAIEQEANALLQGQRQMPATRVLLLFRGLARKVNTGIAAVAVQTKAIPPSEIPQGIVPLGAFSAIVFLSLASVSVMVFLYILSSFRFQVPKTTHILVAALLCTLISLAVFSVFLYMFLGKTSNDANLQEFVSDLNSRNKTSIFVDMTNTSFSDAKAMQACASVLAQSMSDKNKTWEMYSITQTTCTETSSSGANSSLTLSQCQGRDKNATSAFDLSYSQKNEVPKFAVIYANRAQIKGNQDYYDSCPLVSLFS